jgi:hypothetical protein
MFLVVFEIIYYFEQRWFDTKHREARTREERDGLKGYNVGVAD